MRHKVCAALLGAALLTLAVLPCGGSSAQRQRRTTRNSQPGRRTQRQPGRKPPPLVPVHIEFGKDGSIMIKSKNGFPIPKSYSGFAKDGSFSVVLPNAFMDVPAPVGGGRGYTRIDVNRNPKSGALEISFRPKPGARPYYDTNHGRVNVSFSEPAPPPRPRPSPQSGGAQPRTPRGNVNSAAVSPPSVPSNAESAPRGDSDGAERAESQGASPEPPAAAQTQAATAATVQSPPSSATPSTVQDSSVLSPVPTPTGSPAAPMMRPGVGEVLLNNWPAALFAALFLVVGGLVFALRARRGRPRRSAKASAPHSFSSGTVLQTRYRIIGHHGQGGMGSVYEARDERLGLDVALKRTFADTPNQRRAFEREARILANLKHPKLPRVTDSFSEGGEQFLVMDYVPGPDLKALLEQQGSPFTEEDVLRWADELLDALEYMHSCDPPVVHRDIKPSNLKLAERGGIVLLDFGLAKGSVGLTASATHSRSLVGYSLHYAPPEQMQGERTDPRADIYSLGATLYNLLTGWAPPDAQRRATARLTDQPDPLKPLDKLNPGLSPRTSSTIMRALSLKPAQRWQSVTEMRRAFKGDPAPVTVSMDVS